MVCAFVLPRSTPSQYQSPSTYTLTKLANTKGAGSGFTQFSIQRNDDAICASREITSALEITQKSG